jgi:hypothetical protein
MSEEFIESYRKQLLWGMEPAQANRLAARWKQEGGVWVKIVDFPLKLA